MTTEKIIQMQRRVGTMPDGDWKAKSIAACQRHLMRMMPRPHPFPNSSPSHRSRFFGEPGDESQLLAIGVSMLVVKYGGKQVSSIRCHRKIAAQLEAALTDLSASPFRWILGSFAGCYNNRPVTGGTTPSMHARGAAVDFWPEKNGNRQHWPMDAEMPLGVMEIFARHGFLPAGAFWSRDAMHFEATRPAGWIP